MSYPILMVKLYELEKRAAKMQSRIQLSESASLSAIQAEVETLRREYAENELALQNKLRHSKSELVGVLSSAYNDISSIIRRAQDEVKEKELMYRDDEMTAESKLLLSEYELDFSMQAIDRALLVSLDAIAAQLALFKEETKS